MKMDYAMELLADHDLPIGEVAFSTGYADHKAFARAFTARTKESPSAYRKKVLASLR
jgi:AraC-like DNA-binding protein